MFQRIIIKYPQTLWKSWTCLIMIVVLTNQGRTWGDQAAVVARRRGLVVARRPCLFHANILLNSNRLFTSSRASKHNFSSTLKMIFSAVFCAVVMVTETKCFHFIHIYVFAFLISTSDHFMRWNLFRGVEAFTSSHKAVESLEITGTSVGSQPSSEDKLWINDQWSAPLHTHSQGFYAVKLLEKSLELENVLQAWKWFGKWWNIYKILEKTWMFLASE